MSRSNPGPAQSTTPAPYVLSKKPANTKPVGALYGPTAPPAILPSGLGHCGTSNRSHYNPTTSVMSPRYQPLTRTSSNSSLTSPMTPAGSYPKLPFKPASASSGTMKPIEWGNVNSSANGSRKMQPKGAAAADGFKDGHNIYITKEMREQILKDWMTKPRMTLYTIGQVTMVKDGPHVDKDGQKKAKWSAVLISDKDCCTVTCIQTGAERVLSFMKGMTTHGGSHTVRELARDTKMLKGDNECAIDMAALSEGKTFEQILTPENKTFGNAMKAVKDLFGYLMVEMDYYDAQNSSKAWF